MSKSPYVRSTALRLIGDLFMESTNLFSNRFAQKITCGRWKRIGGWSAKVEEIFPTSPSGTRPIWDEGEARGAGGGFPFTTLPNLVGTTGNLNMPPIDASEHWRLVASYPAWGQPVRLNRHSNVDPRCQWKEHAYYSRSTCTGNGDCG